MTDKIINFLRKRDYVYIKELGRGGCGKTVLLHDDIIDEHFVCKKFAPRHSDMRNKLYEGFVNEIKLMHRVFHPNIVRIFSYYIFPENYAGFILMEYVEGETIDKYIKEKSEDFSIIFRQTIDAFCHLEKCGILHRDIRDLNILVRNDGLVKVIDLGFGKAIEGDDDFGKSITLNWACSQPNDFLDSKYDFCTEVYFVGKLFERLQEENEIEDHGLKNIIREMCTLNPSSRIQNFEAIMLRLDQDMLSGPEFAENDLWIYRKFADELSVGISSVDYQSTNIMDATIVIALLEDGYKNFMLEKLIPVNKVACCFLSGPFKYDLNCGIYVTTLNEFINFLKSSSSETQRIILANLFTRMDAIVRYSEDDEIPF